MDYDECLKFVLDQHILWIETYGKEGRAINLSEKDLRFANLSEADLNEARL